MPPAGERRWAIPNRVRELLQRGPRRSGIATPENGPPTNEDIARFLYREARLLDERRWGEWLALWQDDAVYAMPTRRTIASSGGATSPIDELTADDGTWWFDDTKETVSLRVAKLATGKAWAEQPASRTRRFVTNVEVRPSSEPETVFLVRSNLLLYRGRRDCEVEWFSCARADRLTCSGGQFSIAARRVMIDTNVVPADNLVLFF